MKSSKKILKPKSGDEVEFFYNILDIKGNDIYNDDNLKPVNFVETFLYQFLNPKGVIVAIIAVSTYVESGGNFISYSIWLLSIAFLFAVISIIFWTIIGKFMRKFATNEKFIKWFNYVMSALLLSCIATFYY